MSVKYAFQHILPQFLTLDYPFMSVFIFSFFLSFLIFLEWFYEISFYDSGYDLNDPNNDSGDLNYSQNDILMNA